MQVNNLNTEEREVRIDLAALYQLLHHYGMTDLANQAVGARVKGNPETWLVHPYGRFYEEIKASTLIKIDTDGNILSKQDNLENPSPGDINLATWFFKNRAEINYYIHGHCQDVMAVSATERGLLPLTQSSVFLLHMMIYIEYEFHEDEQYAKKFIKTMGDKNIIITRNHGYYVLGITVAEAFFRLYYLRQACSTQLKAQQTGEKLHLIPQKEIDRFVKQMYSHNVYSYDGSREWKGVLHKLDREQPEYKN